MEGDLEGKRPSASCLLPEFAWTLRDKSDSDSSFPLQPRPSLLYYYVAFMLLLHIANLCFADNATKRLPPIHVIRKESRISQCPETISQANC